MSGSLSDYGNAIRSANVLDAIMHPATVNPLAAWGNAAQVASGIWGLREQQAKQAVGQAYQGAVSPEGEFDPARARALVAQNPAAALAAPGAIESTQSLTGQQLQVAAAKAAWVNNATGSLLGQKVITPADVFGVFQQGLANGMLTIPEIQRQLSTLPQDAAGLRTWAQQHYQQHLDPSLQLQQLYGSTGTVTGPGGALTGYTQLPASQGGGVYTPAQPGAPQGLSPGQAITPVTGPVTATGAPTTLPALRYGQQTGVLGPGGQIVGQPGPLGTGRYAPPPPALRNPAAAPPANTPPANTPPGNAPPAGGAGAAPAAPGATPAPAPAAAPGGPAAPPGTMVTGLGPGEQEQMRLAQEHFNDITKQGVAARQQQAVLQDMLGDTSQFTTGPAADRLLKLRQIAQRLGITTNIDATTAAESFNKLAAQLAQQQNPGSDARMSVSLAANPHADLSPPGVDLLLRQLQGNNDYLQARQTLAQSWQADNNNPQRGNHNAFESNIATNLDPRVFQYNRMNPEQKRTFLTGMKDPKSFMRSYDWAHQFGLLPDAS